MLPVNITEGDQPKDSNEVALPEDMAKQLNVGIGDTVRLTSQYAVGTDGKAKADNVRVVGLTSDPNGAYSYYGGAIVGSDNLLAAMQGTDDFDTTGTTTVYLDLALDGNSVSAKTINSVKALLPKHFDLMSRQQVSDESIKSLTGNQTSIVTTFLMCFGVLAMFVAALVIANTFQVLVAQRRRTLALLRTIGAKKASCMAPCCSKRQCLASSHPCLAWCWEVCSCGACASATSCKRVCDSISLGRPPSYLFSSVLW